MLNDVIRPVALGAVLCGVLLLTGCRFFERRPVGDSADYHITTLDGTDSLQDGSFYIQHQGGKYDALYFGQSSFQPGTTADADPSRVLWFGKDFACIPTMHKGEALVFRSGESLPETVSLERFEDIGYTIGICNMSASGSSGRYRFSTDPEDLNIDVQSDADRLCRLGSATALIDRIGHTSLRSGNISRGGTIVGLEEGRTYRTDVYIGTTIYPFDLVADVRAMLSMETAAISHYTLTSNSLATYSFPDGLESGYYLINGTGLLRYINSGKEWDESMDMAIPNGDLDAESEVESSPDPEKANDAVSVPFRLDRDSRVTVTVDYGVSGRSYRAGRALAAPTARLIGENGAYALNADGEKQTLSVTATLTEGQYVLQIAGLGGRTYTYRITRLSEGSQPSSEAQEAGSDGSSTSSAGPSSAGSREAQAASSDTPGRHASESGGAAGTDGTVSGQNPSGLTMAERLQRAAGTS